MNQPLTLVKPVPATAPGTTSEAPDFLVRSRQEILRLLDGMLLNNAPLSVSFSNPGYVLASSLLYVDEDSSMLLLDCPAEWQAALKAGADSVRLRCALDDAHIEFQGSTCVLVDLDGTPVAGMPIPEFMWRFQRRREPRQSVSGLTIVLNMDFLEAEAEVIDLSVAGIGMLNCNREVKLDNGEVLRNCAIALPGVGQIAVDLVVQHQHEVELADGRAVTRVGCRISGLSDSKRQLIANYLEALSDC
jgi:c-di-GMP-binding flagellar brake protein YcgR